MISRNGTNRLEAEWLGSPPWAEVVSLAMSLA